MRLKTLTATLAGAVALSLNVALADFAGPWFTPVSSPMLNENIFFNDILLPQIVEGADAEKGAARLAAEPIASLSYVQDPSVTTTAKREFVDQLIRDYPQYEKEIRGEMRNADFPKIYRRIANNIGYEFRNVSHTVAAYMVTGWIVSNGRDTTPDQERAALAQIAPVVARMQTLQDPALRQRLDEDMMIYIVILGDGFTTAQRKGPDALKTYSDQASALLEKNLGVDFRALDLTAQGFARKS